MTHWAGVRACVTRDNHHHCQRVHIVRRLEPALPKSGFKPVLLYAPHPNKMATTKIHNRIDLISSPAIGSLCGKRESPECTAAKGRKAVGDVGHGACCHGSRVWGGEEMRKLATITAIKNHFHAINNGYIINPITTEVDTITKEKKEKETESSTLAKHLLNIDINLWGNNTEKIHSVLFRTFFVKYQLGNIRLQQSVCPLF